MAKLESSFKNMLLVLSGITLFSALALGAMYNLTKDPIEKSKIAKQENAIKAVLPSGFDHISAPDTVDFQNEKLVIFKAMSATNELMGAAVQSTTNSGFSGAVVVMVGFKPDGSIVDYSVLEQKETPGLGTKMVEWFKDKQKPGQDITAMNAANDNLTVSKDGGDVDAITAATISSRAFLLTITNAYAVFKQKMNESKDLTQPIDSVSTIQKQ